MADADYTVQSEQLNTLGNIITTVKRITRRALPYSVILINHAVIDDTQPCCINTQERSQ